MSHIEIKLSSADNNSGNTALTTLIIKKANWVGINIPGTNAHMTLAWCGFLTDEKLTELKHQVKLLKLKLQECKCQIEFLDQWKTFGKDEDIKQGRGVQVRLCRVLPEFLNVDLLEFYKQWYHHDVGEPEEKRHKPNYHVTLGKISREDLEKLTIVDGTDIFVK